MSGPTQYNILCLNEVPSNKEDHPLDPVPKILKTDDIVLRVDPRKLNKTREKTKTSQKQQSKYSSSGGGGGGGQG